MFTLYSITDIHLANEVPFDPRVLLEVSGVDRVGSLSAAKVWEVEMLGRLDSQRLEGDAGTSVAKLLADSLVRRVYLWISVVDPQRLERLQQLYGSDVFVAAGPRTPVPTHMKLRHPQADELVPVAVNPLRLVERLLSGAERERRWVQVQLEGIDSKTISSQAYRVLVDGGVDVLARSRAFRALHSPKFIAYLVVFVYSLLRALPVFWVPNFRGNVWVLWAIDVVSAIPYTWGILEFVVGRTWWRRTAGLLVTIVTFVSPYIYFLTNGRHYPFFVNLVVAGMIASAILFEGYRWIRDRRVAAVLRKENLCA